MLSSVLEDTYQQSLSAPSNGDQSNLARNLTFLSHQMVLLMRSLNIPFCRCKPCVEHLECETGSISNVTLTPSVDGLTNDHCSTSIDLQPLNGVDGSDSVQALLASATCNQMAGDDQISAEGLDRRHKYYTSRKERYEIAKCGRIYGVQVAAKKYNIPPYAVRYYVNTMARSLKLSKLKIRPKRMFLANIPKVANKEERRGRPSLLGKELDVALLNHLIEVKSNLFGGSLNVSQGLRIAKEFLQSRAPTVLAECGGNVKLSYSWGTSLLKRMTEREAEIEENKSCKSSPEGSRNCTNEATDVVRTDGASNASCSADNATSLTNSELSSSAKFSKRYNRKGRPLLLGEELDKKLLDHLIRLEQTNPGEISSVSRALQNAQNFLHDNAPGLLVEDGGTLKLGYSWAISMLRRVVDRAKELREQDKQASVSEVPAQDAGKSVYFLNSVTDAVASVVVDDGDQVALSRVKQEPSSQFT